VFEVELLTHIQAFVVQPDGGTETGSPTWWVVVAAFGVIISILAGVHYFYSLISRRRIQAAEDRYFETLASQHDAEEAKQDVAAYETLRAQLRDQVDKEVPREARRIFIENRRDQLVNSIGEQFDEYERLGREVAAMPEANSLDDRVRQVIEARVAPLYRRSQRRERALAFGIGVLVIVSLIPISPGQLIFAYFAVLREPDEWTVGTILLACSVAVAVLGGTLTVLGRRWLARHQAYEISDFGVLAVLMGVALALFSGGAAFNYGLQSRNEALDMLDSSKFSSGDYDDALARATYSFHYSVAAFSMGAALTVIGAMLFFRHRRVLQR
jgi:hypothetical protein